MDTDKTLKERSPPKKVVLFLLFLSPTKNTKGFEKRSNDLTKAFKLILIRLVNVMMIS